MGHRRKEKERKVTEMMMLPRKKNLITSDLLRLLESKMRMSLVCATFLLPSIILLFMLLTSPEEKLTVELGGMKVKADREESSPYAAMLASVDVVKALKSVGINAIHIKLRGRGGCIPRPQDQVPRLL